MKTTRTSMTQRRSTRNANPIARDLRSPKYSKRIVRDKKKTYNRQKEKQVDGH
jgi:hypothetical protein